MLWETIRRTVSSKVNKVIISRTLGVVVSGHSPTKKKNKTGELPINRTHGSLHARSPPHTSHLENPFNFITNHPLPQTQLLTLNTIVPFPKIRG